MSEFAKPDGTENIVNEDDKDTNDSPKPLCDSRRHITNNLNQRMERNMTKEDSNTNNEVNSSCTDMNANSNLSAHARSWYPDCSRNNQEETFSSTPNQNSVRQKKEMGSKSNVNGVTFNPWKEYKVLEKQVSSAYPKDNKTDNLDSNSQFQRNNENMIIFLDGTVNTDYVPIPMPPSAKNEEEVHKPPTNEFDEIAVAMSMVTLDTVYQTSNPFFRNPTPEQWGKRLAEVEREFIKQFRYPDRSIWVSPYFQDTEPQQVLGEPLYLFFDNEFKIWKNPPEAAENAYDEKNKYQLPRKQVGEYSNSEYQYWARCNQNQPRIQSNNYNCNSQATSTNFYNFQIPPGQISYPMYSFNPDQERQNEATYAHKCKTNKPSNTAQPSAKIQDFYSSTTCKRTNWAQGGAKIRKLDDRINNKSTLKKIQPNTPILKESAPIVADIKNMKILFKEPDLGKKLPQKNGNKPVASKKTPCKTANGNSNKSINTVNLKTPKSKKEIQQPKKQDDKIVKEAAAITIKNTLNGPSFPMKKSKEEEPNVKNTKSGKENNKPKEKKSSTKKGQPKKK